MNIVLYKHIETILDEFKSVKHDENDYIHACNSQKLFSMLKNNGIQVLNESAENLECIVCHPT